MSFLNVYTPSLQGCNQEYEHKQESTTYNHVMRGHDWCSLDYQLTIIMNYNILSVLMVLLALLVVIRVLESIHNILIKAEKDKVGSFDWTLQHMFYETRCMKDSIMTMQKDIYSLKNPKKKVKGK